MAREEAKASEAVGRMGEAGPSLLGGTMGGSRLQLCDREAPSHMCALCLLHAKGRTEKDYVTEQLDQDRAVQQKNSNIVRMEGPIDFLYVSLCPSLITGVFEPHGQWQVVVFLSLVVSVWLWCLGPVVSGRMCCLCR